MKIELIYEPKRTKGLVIVIDVIRAATVAAFILGNNAKYIIPVKTKTEAIALKKMKPEYLLVGEIDGYNIEGFDYGNSPSEVKNVDFTDQIIVHRSSLGTSGLLAFPDATEIIFGSFVTFSAIKNYLKKTQPRFVSFFPTGGYGSDDERFAYYLYKDLHNHSVDIQEEREYIKNLDNRFSNPKKPEFPEEDIELSLTLDTFPFICITKKYEGNLIVKKLEI